MALGFQIGDTGLNPNHGPYRALFAITPEYNASTLMGLSLGDDFDDVTASAKNALDDATDKLRATNEDLALIVSKLRTASMQAESSPNEAARQQARSLVETMFGLLEKAVASFVNERARFERAKGAMAAALLAKEYSKRGLTGEAAVLRNEAIKTLGTPIPIDQAQVAADVVAKIRGASTSLSGLSDFVAKDQELKRSMHLPYSAEPGRPMDHFYTGFADRLLSVADMASGASRADAIAALGSNALPPTALEPLKRIRSRIHDAVFFASGRRQNGPMGEVTVEDQGVDLGDLGNIFDDIGGAISDAAGFVVNTVKATVPSVGALALGISTGNPALIAAGANNLVGQVSGAIGGKTPTQQQAAQQAAAAAAAQYQNQVPAAPQPNFFMRNWPLFVGGAAVLGLVAYLALRKRK